MTTKPLLLLAALTLCCCIASLHAAPGCKCIRTTSNRVKVRLIEKIEVIPIAGHCRRIEIIITRKSGTRVCIDPNAKWIHKLLSNLQRSDEVTSGSTTVSPNASNILM